MKPSKAIKSEANASVTKWRKVLNLDGWEITVSFMDGVSDKNPQAAAMADFGTWVYKSAGLSFFDPFYALDYEQRDETVLHELVHVVLSPLTVGIIQRQFNEQYVTQSMFDDCHERTTQELTNIISAFYKL